VSSIPISQGKSAFNMQSFDLANWDPRRRHRNLHLRRTRRSGGSLKFHIEAAGIEIVRPAQSDDASHEVREFPDVSRPGV
jgi:hypothetical protein